MVLSQKRQKIEKRSEKHTFYQYLEDFSSEKAKNFKTITYICLQNDINLKHHGKN